MLNEATVHTMNALKLFGMARGFPERLADPNHAQLDHAEFVGLLVEDEKTHRESKRLRRLLKNARLRFPGACLEDVDYSHPRNLPKAFMRELATTTWIEAHRNVVLVGPTGIGKSWLACALGNHAARAGFTVIYVRAPRLFESLQQSRGDGTHLKALNRLAKADVLVVDDFLITPLAAPERRDFLEIVEDRYQAASTVIATQCPIERWHQAIGDPTLADAICDRLVHNAYKLELKGPSLRSKADKDSGKPS
ncbi:MAG: ATP-binding protein [Chloroflexi bacterium]|nr:ATP-binding protein [Chloroflexota bacterium]